MLNVSLALIDLNSTHGEQGSDHCYSASSETLLPSDQFTAL